MSALVSGEATAEWLCLQCGIRISGLEKLLLRPLCVGPSHTGKLNGEVLGPNTNSAKPTLPLTGHLPIWTENSF